MTRTSTRGERVDVSAQKEALLDVYAGPAWRERVRKMSAAQISAIYLRLKGQGKVK